MTTKNFCVGYSDNDPYICKSSSSPIGSGDCVFQHLDRIHIIAASVFLARCMLMLLAPLLTYMVSTIPS